MRLDALIGERLGRYQIEALIGQGGMAAVYRAFDPALQRAVALKVLYPQYLADADLVERFRREAVTAAGLDHPNIAPIYDVGEVDGLVYLTMKLLPGPSLAELLQREGRLPLARLVPIMHEIASALEEAHKAGVIHRDIKPGNVIFDRHGRALLTDFGIAKSLQSAALTQSSMLIGTPDYIAPEQIDSQLAASGQIDGRADIYSLGAMLYRALTGRRPFEGTPQSVLLAHLRDEPPPPSAFVPGLPPVVDAILGRAMAKEPAARYATTEELARDLEAALGDTTAIGPVFPAAAAYPAAYAQPTTGAAGGTTASQQLLPPPIATIDAGRRQRTTRRPAVALATLAALIVLGAVLFRFAARAAEPDEIASAADVLPRSTAQMGIIPAATATETPSPSPSTPAVAAGDSTATEEGVATPEGALTTARGPTATATLPIEAQTVPTRLIPLPPTSAPVNADPTTTTRPPAPTATRPLPPPTATQPPPPTATQPPPPTATQPPTATTPPPPPTVTQPPPPTVAPPPTVTPTPEPAGCSAPLQGGFGRLWESSETIQARLGCPLRGETPGPAAEQIFETGTMYWWGSNQQIFVLDGGRSGTWTTYPNTWQEGEEQTPLEPPPPLVAPVRGFGKVWRNNPAVSEALGWGERPESGLTGVYQRFEDGTMLFSPAINGHEPQIYVLFADGSFTIFPDA